MRIIFLLIFLATGFISQGQILTPAKWTYQVSPASAAIGETVELVFKVKIDNNWYLYSTEFPCEDGPIKTTMTFKPHPGFVLIGGVRPVGAKLKHDKIFDCDVNIFTGTAEFRQKIKILKNPVVIAGEAEYQVCSDIDGKCIPFGDEFEFTGLTITSVKTGGVQTDTQDSIPFSNPQQTQITNDQAAVVQGPTLDKSVLEGTSNLDNDSIWGYLLFAFIVGLTSLITPCVFPMIPMTVTFFLKDNQTRRQGIRKALIFGISIVAIYTSAGTVVAFILGPDGLNALATHWAPNLFVFVIFIVFALSFFGLFEINAPNQLLNKVDKQAEKGGLLGIFFMAATLVLVSFSCTVPIVGSVLFLTVSGEVLRPVMAMFSYSLAFAIPFTVFAIFPEWIKSLPKSGGWLNSVKVTLGFLELALSLKFLSIADQAYHWGILDRDVNIVIWIVIFALLGFYILGKLKMSSDTPVESITVPRLLMAIGIFSFVVYLVPGLLGAPLKMLAGYLPPVATHDFDLAAIKGNNVRQEGCEEPRFNDLLHLPHGLSGYFDYRQAIECARKQNKPVFIDFTGHGCTNCREMEAIVWSDPQVLKRLKEDFVVVALYVDDKTELPESEWFTSKYDGKVKKTIGKQNADLQINNLQNNAQPFYVLVGKDERVLAWPYGYDRSVEEFVKFLERGKAKYKELYP